MTFHQMFGTWDFHRPGVGHKRLNRMYLKPTQLYALVFGVIHVSLGVTGLLIAPGLESHALLAWFPMNGPHSLLHLSIGLAGISALKLGWTLEYARSMAVLFALLTLSGFLPQPLFGLIEVGGADMFLHGIIGVAGDCSSREYTRW